MADPRLLPSADELGLEECILRVARGDASPEDAQRVDQLRALSPAHEEAVAEILFVARLAQLAPRFDTNPVSARRVVTLADEREMAGEA